MIYDEEARIIDVSEDQWDFASIVGDWDVIDPEEAE